jgi:hypothetical protein
MPGADCRETDISILHLINNNAGALEDAAHDGKKSV